MPVEATIRVEDDGTVKFLDANEQPLNDYLTNLAKRQQGGRIREVLEETSARINAETDALGKIHCYTPRPEETPTHSKRAFEKQAPQAPVSKQVSFFARLFGKRAEIESENADAQRLHYEEFSRWNSEKALFDAREEEESRTFDRLLRTDAEFMQQNYCHFTRGRLMGEPIFSPPEHTRALAAIKLAAPLSETTAITLFKERLAPKRKRRDRDTGNRALCRIGHDSAW